METPYWWLDAPLEETQAAAPDGDCDVLIVGAGYTGLSAAIVLARAGRSVQVFDALRPGEGASSRNGGIASGNLRHSFTSAIASLGQDRALDLFREGHTARKDLATFVRDEAIECGYQVNGRFTGAMNERQLDFQKGEAELISRHLDVDARTIGRDDLHNEIGTDIYAGGLVREDLATVHPGKLHAGMLRVARKSGARIFGNAAIEGFAANRTGFDVAVAGRKIKAAKLIVATNGYSGAADPWLRRRLVPIASRIVVSHEIPNDMMDRLLPKRRAMGETRKLFRYFRPTPDGKRILLGSREKALSASPQQNAAHVFRGLVEIFPELEAIGFEYSWNGNVAFSRDEMPSLFEKDRVIYACGYCGSGVVWARWLGAKAALKVLNDPAARTVLETNPPPAIPLFSGRPWFLPAFMGLYALQDRIARR